MSESKQTPEQWKSETSREERKARLDGLKAKEGGKKPIRFNNPVVRLVIVIVVIIGLLTLGSWYAVRMGVPARYLTAATIGGEKIKGIELNFYYYSIANQYGFSPTSDEGKEMLKGPSNMEGFEKLSDYVKDSAAKELQGIVLLASKAKAAGLTLTADDTKRIEDYFTSAKTQADTEGVTLDSLMASTFGVGMTQAQMRPILERILLSNLYSEKKLSELTFTDAELTTYYEANKADIDIAEYRQFLVTSDAAADAPAEAVALAMAAAKTKAEQMLAKVRDDETFKAAAIEFAIDAEKDSYRTGDKTLLKNVSKSSAATAEVGTWALDAARKAGDTIVSEASDGYYVIMFNSRGRADFSHVSIRHILIDAARATATPEQIATAKAKAEQILSQYKAGPQTAEAFGELAKTNSIDTGSAATGGLYNNVQPGEMVPEFDSWIFDQARKTGDTGIVQTDFGFHIMYFDKVDGVDWKIKATEALKTQTYNKFLKDETVNFPYTFNKIGSYFVG